MINSWIFHWQTETVKFYFTNKNFNIHFGYFYRNTGKKFNTYY